MPCAHLYLSGNLRFRALTFHPVSNFTRAVTIYSCTLFFSCVVLYSHAIGYLADIFNRVLVPDKYSRSPFYNTWDNGIFATETNLNGTEQKDYHALPHPISNATGMLQRMRSFRVLSCECGSTSSNTMTSVLVLLLASHRSSRFNRCRSVQ